MINLAEEWRKLDGRRRKPDSREHWDERAKTFSFKDAPDAYLRSFISKAGITGKESVLDMGCGTGSLAVALASLGCSVIAADFSTGMLDRLRLNAAERGMLWNGEASRHDSGALPGSGASLVSSDSLAGDGACEGGTRGGTCNAGARNAATPLPEVGVGKILPLHMSWEDDWTSFGLGKNAVDVAVSSRSLITHDLEDSLIKLSTVARERVCVTVGTGVSPRVDMRVARAMGLGLERHNDALYVFGIASDLGYEPTVSYIHSHRSKSYVSPDEAYSSLMETREFIADAADQISVEESASRLRAFLADHLVETEEQGVRRWTLDKPRIVPWAFISWNVRV